MKIKPYRFEVSTYIEHGFEFWCWGCCTTHRFITHYTGNKRADQPKWEFGGNYEKPSFSPSLMIQHRRGYWAENKQYITDGRLVTECHLIVDEGHIHYLTDCLHPFKNMVFGMADVPQTREQSLALMDSVRARRLLAKDAE